MKKLFYFAAMLSSLAVMSCEGLSLEPGKGPDEGNEEKALISFAKAEVGEDFPQMELLFGLTIGEPVNVSNVKLIADEDGNITTEEKLYWGEGQKTASTFTAYFPYDASYRDTVNVFSVKEDQSSEEKFILSNLMTATTSASPSTKFVSMNFKNRMAGLDMYFDNRTGKTIKEVYVSSVYPAVNLNIVNGECVTIQNNPVDIKMLYVTTTAKGLDLYNAIIPVQTSSLALNVVYTDGSSQTCTLDSAIALEAKVYSTDENPIILAKDATEATFSVTVSDWANGGSFSFLKEEDEYTMQIEISEITHKSFKAAFTPSDKEVYYIFAAYSKSYLDELLKTYTLESLILERIEGWRPYNEPYYGGIEKLMSLLCNKGDFYTTFTDAPAETEVSVLAAFFDAHGNLISKCFREDSKTLPRPAGDEAYENLLGTYTLPVLDYFNNDAPFEASVVIEADEVNETFVFSMPELSPDTYLAVYNAETGTLKLTNGQLGRLGYYWDFGVDWGYCAIGLDMLFWNSDLAVGSIAISPNQDGSVLTLSSSPAVPAQDTLCLISGIYKQGDTSFSGHYRFYKLLSNTLTEAAPAKAVSEKGLTSFKTKETGILPKRNMKGAKIHKELR
ncbi:MAG: fimbrillin family protein [Bacteroidales bacterium]|nr:fimbrillin family protein [Bacteroidales bacterium]